MTICSSRQKLYPLTKEWRRGSSCSGSTFSPSVGKDDLFIEGAEGVVLRFTETGGDFLEQGLSLFPAPL